MKLDKITILEEINKIGLRLSDLIVSYLEYNENIPTEIIDMWIESQSFFLEEYIKLHKEEEKGNQMKYRITDTGNNVFVIEMSKDEVNWLKLGDSFVNFESEESANECLTEYKRFKNNLFERKNEGHEFEEYVRLQLKDKLIGHFKKIMDKNENN